MSQAADLGVVDPIRVPGAGRAAALWRRAPILARVFALLAALDLVVRGLGLIGPPLALDLGRPLAIIGSVLPRTLWILLPAIIVLRRPDVWWSTPKLLFGSVVLALATLVVAPATGLLVSAANAGGIDFMPASIVLSALSGVLLIAAWYFLGSGFTAIRPRPAAPTGFIWSNLIAAAAIIGAACSLITIAVVNNANRDYDFAAAQGYLSGLFVLVALVTARANWIVARGVGDPLRPMRATWIAGLSGALVGFAGMLTSAVGTWVVLNPPVPDAIPGEIISAIGLAGWLGLVVAPSLLVLAIAIGLIDPDRPAPVEAPVA